MHLDSTNWRRLTPDIIAELPEAAGVFEVGNLVRTILYIGGADGNLRARLAALSVEQAKRPACAGGYVFRYELTGHEQETVATRLETYREHHGGQLPAGNREAPRRLRLAARSAA
jgi:hypothetical protein